jgi:methylmalonyl-CoA/ethylmalonyl-CoA epimerase
MTPVSFELDHVALGVPRIEDAAHFLVETLGGEEHGGGPGLGFRFFQWEFAGGGKIEILEPAGAPDGFLHRFLERRGPGIHHVTFKVPDLEAAAEQARGCGYEIVGWFDADPSWKECFLHPKQAQGIVVQLAEENPRASTGDPASWPRIELPPRPAEVPAPVTLLALRLAARDAVAARRQWQHALGGEPREVGEGVIEFRYGSSPIRIVVETRADAEEGPIALELATERAWPAAGREALGARFVRRDEAR